LLVTHDLELAPDHDGDGQRRILDTLIERLARIEIPTTVFATASAAEQFRNEVRAFAGAGHEIACHGVSHGREENLQRANPARAAAIISEGTSRLTTVVGSAPRCFRGPFSSTSAAAQRALIDNRYWADFSVCPGRLDFMLTRGGTVEWLRAPEIPYQPSAASPFRRGDLPLWVIPLSARGLPFLSGVMYLMGLGFATRLFDALHRESLRTGQPIVFLFHSYEFAEPCPRRRGSAPPRKLLHRLYEQNRQVRLENMFRLLDHMRCATGITALTGSDYVTQYCSTESEAMTCTSS
jgi:peptidoglycan/xylan/chitin deacetylase (PgdA/CDA1 family)